MNVLTEFSMPLSAKTYKYLVTGEDCQVVAKQAIKELLEKTMETALIERMEARKADREHSEDRRNGYYERKLLTSWGWITGIRVPRGRCTSIADVVLPKYKRTQPEFDAAVLYGYLLGHSTRNSAEFFEQFLQGTGVSKTQVSRIISRLDENCRKWRNRPLTKAYAYLWLDGKYAAIKGAVKRPYSVLWAYGATEEGERELLGFQIHRSEGTVHWESLLIDLLDRGFDPTKLKLITRDENSGCEQAILSLFGNIPQQSCAVHLERNIGKLVKKPNREQFQQQVSDIFKQPTEYAARKKAFVLEHVWLVNEPEACIYLRNHLDQSLVFYSAAPRQWHANVKATNLLERFFRELKRFEKSRQFRYANHRSCERFYYAFAKLYNDKHRRMPYFFDT